MVYHEDTIKGRDQADEDENRDEDPDEGERMKPEQLGPYRIVRTLGRGGMGAVYEGIHVDTDEPAAIKILSGALAQEPDFRQRFEAEIETLKKLYHPNIVQLFGFGEQDEYLFYAMELVDGSSLEEELRQGRVFDWREVARIGIETCRALRHAHDRGVTHRDIKPANLLVSADGRVKLSDFGIARLFGNTRLTAAGNVLGTAEYMAPEQAEGRPVGPRTDLYSLGAVLYCLAARRPPFRAGSLPEMLQKHRTAQPDPVRRHAPDTPAELDRIILQLLRRTRTSGSPMPRSWPGDWRRWFGPCRSRRPRRKGGCWSNWRASSTRGRSPPRIGRGRRARRRRGHRPIARHRRRKPRKPRVPRRPRPCPESPAGPPRPTFPWQPVTGGAA